MNARTLPTCQSPIEPSAQIMKDDLELVEQQMTRSMDRLFLSIVHIDQLMSELGSVGTKALTSSDWLGDLRSVRDELDNVLIHNDQVRELLSTVSAAGSGSHAAPSPLDLNRCLARVAYVTRALVPDRLQIVEHLSTVPVIVGSPHAFKQAIIKLVSLAAKAIDEQGLITLGSRTRSGQVDIVIEAFPSAVVFDAKALDAQTERIWPAAVAALAAQGAAVIRDDRHDDRFCIRITWPTPMVLMG